MGQVVGILCDETTPLEHIVVSLSWSFFQVKLCLHLPQAMDYTSFPVTECTFCFFLPKQNDIEVLHGVCLCYGMSYSDSSIRKASEAIKRK